MAQPAARLSDMHTCPMSDGPKPHVGGPILPPCAPTVLTGWLPQARVGDLATCVGPPDVIVKGAFTVLVSGQPAARLGDMTAHGGVIVTGQLNVLIGDGAAVTLDTLDFAQVTPMIVVERQGSDQAETARVLQQAARQGTPFSEQCAGMKR